MLKHRRYSICEQGRTCQAPSKGTTLTHELDCELGTSLQAAALEMVVASSLGVLKRVEDPAQTVWMCPVPCPPDSTCGKKMIMKGEVLRAMCRVPHLYQLICTLFKAKYSCSTLGDAQEEGLQARSNVSGLCQPLTKLPGSGE